MSVLPRCICDPLDAMIGKYDPRCSRHLGVSNPFKEKVEAMTGPSDSGVQVEAALPALPDRRALPVIGSGIAGHALGYTADQMREYALAARPLPVAALSDEQIFEIAKQHLGEGKEHGHDLIWPSAPDYAAVCDMPKDARWSMSNVRAESTLAFARALLRHSEGKAASNNNESAP